MTERDPLFDQTFLRKLDRLSLVVRKRRSGAIKGERRSTKRGTSVEFADYRDYVRGDDLRRVDWNIYARLERPFVKLFEEEEDLSIHILIDASGSMGAHGCAGKGAANKWIYARRVAAALGYIALSSGDRLAVSMLHNEQDRQAISRFGPARSKTQTLTLLRFLDQGTCAGTTNLDRTLRTYAATAHRPGLAILISDLFSQSDTQSGLSALLSRGYETIILHTLAPAEINPSLHGDLRLLDVETGQHAEVTVNAGMRRIYRQRLAAWRQDLGRWCSKRGIAYVPVSTDLPFDQLILFHLRQRGLVR